MDEAIHQQFLEICRKVGWKCTSQRLAVYDFLYANTSHPDVDEVWQAVQKKLPAITRESVYRILNELADKAIISRMDHIESARYDSKTVPHGHFICRNCEAISDFELPAGVDFSAVKLSGVIQQLEFRAVGLCENCLHNKTAAPKK